MKLSENLRRIRKENNLSQEQLAEKLGVSRQAVSKWESGQSYPEMDKVLQICKTFNFNMDELMNENVKEVAENKQVNSNINKTIEDFFEFITKTVDMFSAMKFMQKIKCIFEQLIMVVILFLVVAFGLLILKEITHGILGFLPDGAYVAIRNILQSLYLCATAVLSVAIILHVFKVRYLDYYEVIKTEDKISLNDELENVKLIEEQKEIVETKGNNKVFLEKKKEKIVIRDPKHSHSKFLNGIFKIFMWCIKFAVACFATFFAITFVGLVGLLVLSLVFTKTGLVFVGAFLGIIASLIINFIILKVLYNFIVSKKSNKSRMAIMSLISLILLGVSVSSILIGVTKFDYVEDIPENYIVKDTYNFEMSENLVILPWQYITEEFKFVESDLNDIKVVVEHSKLNVTQISREDDVIQIYGYSDSTKYMEIIRDIINDINNKKIIGIRYLANTTIYASKENIEKIRENNANYRNLQTENELQRAYDKIEKLNNEIDLMKKKEISSETIVSDKDNEIVELLMTIEQKNSELEDMKQELMLKEQENISLQEKLANIQNVAN